MILLQYEPYSKYQMSIDKNGMNHFVNMNSKVEIIEGLSFESNAQRKMKKHSCKRVCGFFKKIAQLTRIDNFFEN
jgi:hypothetical protein